MKSQGIKFFLPFLICFLLFTPLGLFSDKVDPFEHSSFFSLTTIDAMDDQGYYSYLRSLVFDGDIDFFNENNYAYYLFLTQTGYTMNLWPVGPAVLWTPFFLAAQACQWVLQELGLATNVQGYGWSHLIATGLASCFYVFCGLLLLYRTLALFFSRNASLVTVWTLFLSSPLVYFTFIRNRMGAFCEFFAICLFLFLWCHRPRGKRFVLWAFSLGCSLALVVMSRPTNAAVGFLPLLIFLGLTWENFRTKNWTGLKQASTTGVWVFFAFILAFSIQFLCWFILFGKFYPNDPHLAHFQSIIVPESLTYLLGRLVAVLGGPYFGLLYCFQPWLIGFIGLFFLRPDNQKFAPLPGQVRFLAEETNWFKWAVILIVFIPFYLTLTWPAENSSYGRRLLIASIPFIAFGFAALYERFHKTKWKNVFLGVAGLSILLNLAHMVQFRWKLDYFDPWYSWHALKNIPHLFADPAGFLSTSFFKVVTQVSPSSTTDWFFMAGIPILMILLLGAGLMFCGTGNRERAKLFFLRFNFFLPIFFTTAAVLTSLFLSITYKTFSQDELSRRTRFIAIMRQYPEFIFNDTRTGNEKELQEAVQLNPQSSRAFMQMGTYYFKTRDLKQAAWYYERSIDLDETNHNAWWGMGMVLKKEGRKEFLDYYSRALRLQPHRRYRYEYLFERANNYYFEKKYRRAIETLMKVIRLAPSWATPHENLAVNYFYLNELENARTYALKAKSLGTDVSKILSAIKQAGH